MPAPGWLRPALALLGSLMLVAGIIGIVIGFAAAGWLRDQIPGITADASVVGGAARRRPAEASTSRRPA
jgi:hypothetical protein